MSSLPSLSRSSPEWVSSSSPLPPSVPALVSFLPSPDVEFCGYSYVLPLHIQVQHARPLTCLLCVLQNAPPVRSKVPPAYPDVRYVETRAHLLAAVPYLYPVCAHSDFLLVFRQALCADVSAQGARRPAQPAQRRRRKVQRLTRVSPPHPVQTTARLLQALISVADRGCSLLCLHPGPTRSRAWRTSTCRLRSRRSLPRGGGTPWRSRQETLHDEIHVVRYHLRGRNCGPGRPRKISASHDRPLSISLILSRPTG